jgi:hypothetical protein
MPIQNFVIARNDDEARTLVSAGYGVETVETSRVVLANITVMMNFEIPLAPFGDYGIYAVTIQVKRLDVGVGSA